MFRLALVILWPSFLAAIVAEGVVFSLLDPGGLPLAGIGAELPPIAIYTAGFFLLWTACALASLLTCYLMSSGSGCPPS